MGKSIEKRRFESYDKTFTIKEAIAKPEEVIKAIAAKQINPYQRPIKEWQFIPSKKEIEKLIEFAYGYETATDGAETDEGGLHGKQGCPECKKGRLVMTNEGSGMGTALVLRCKWGKKDCTYELDITDYGMW